MPQLLLVPGEGKRAHMQWPAQHVGCLMMSHKENPPLPNYFITERKYIKFSDTACMKASGGEQVISSISNFFL